MREHKGWFIEQQVGKCVLSGFDLRDVGQPETTGDLLRSDVAKQRSAVLDRLRKVREGTH